MVSRLAAFVIWAAVAASAVFWGTRLVSRPTAVPAYAALVSPADAYQGDLTRLLGVDAPPPPVAIAPPPAAVPADARFRLLGVVAPRTTSARAGGLALIALDGKPAKPYRVGATVDGELVLLAVHARGASLGPRGQAAQFALELPALPGPSTGTPPGAATPRAGMALPARPLPPRPAGEASQLIPNPAAPPSSEAQPDPGDRPIYVPPTGAGQTRAPV